MRPEQQESERLQREVAKLKAEHDILKKLRRTSPGMRYEVRLHREAPVGSAAILACSALGVSHSGFHGWLTRRASPHAVEDERITRRFRASFLASDRTYGAWRVWHDVLAEGIHYGLHRIERLMRQQGLRARPRRRGLPLDRGERPSLASANILDRQFEAEQPNQKWIADFTSICTAEGQVGSTSPPRSTSSPAVLSGGR